MITKEPEDFLVALVISFNIEKNYLDAYITSSGWDYETAIDNMTPGTKYTEYFNQTNSSGLVNSFHHHNSTVLDYLNKQGGNLSNKNKPKNILDNQENRIENPEFSAEMLTQKLEQK